MSNQRRRFTQKQTLFQEKLPLLLHLAKPLNDFVSYVEGRLHVSTEPGPQCDVRQLLHQVLVSVEKGSSPEEALMKHDRGRRRRAISFLVEGLEIDSQLSLEVQAALEALSSRSNSREPEVEAGDRMEIALQ